MGASAVAQLAADDMGASAVAQLAAGDMQIGNQMSRAAT
jgi:hypothetical protein